MFFRSLSAKGRANSSRAKRSLSRQSATPKRCLLQIESLECRLVPSCNPGVFGGVLRANCDNNSNTVTLFSSGGQTFLNQRQFADSTFNSILIDTGTAADTVNIQATPTARPVTVDGGGGLDDVNIGLSGSLALILSSIDVRNPPSDGFTALTVNNFADTTARTLTLTDSQITSPFGVPIRYAASDLRSLSFNGGSGDNTYRISSTPFSSFSGGVVTSLRGGTGTDTFVVSGTTAGTILDLTGGTSGVKDYSVAGASSQLQTDIRGEVRIHGTAGQPQTLQLDDRSNSNGQTYTFTETALTRPGQVPFRYEDILQVVLLTGTGDDTVNVQSSAAFPFLNLLDSGGTNTLVGPNADVTWQFFDGIRSDELRAAGDDHRIASFQTIGGTTNLVGGGGNDTFKFSDGSQYAGSIGGGGTNTLDYSAYTSDVYANLQTGVATGVAGGIANIRNVTGGQANNILVGNGNSNVLTVFGGHNLVIAGGSGGTLNGGNGTNILIGGTTDYDADFTSLRAILDFWNNVTPANYHASVDALLAGNGVPALNTDTVHSNGGGNHFSGGLLNLYFGSHDGGLDTFDPEPPNGRVIEI